MNELDDYELKLVCGCGKRLRIRKVYDMPDIGFVFSGYCNDCKMIIDYHPPLYAIPSKELTPDDVSWLKEMGIA